MEIYNLARVSRTLLNFTYKQVGKGGNRPGKLPPRGILFIFYGIFACSLYKLQNYFDIVPKFLLSALLYSRIAHMAELNLWTTSRYIHLKL